MSSSSTNPTHKVVDGSPDGSPIKRYDIYERGYTVGVPRFKTWVFIDYALNVEGAEYIVYDRNINATIQWEV